MATHQQYENKIEFKTISECEGTVRLMHDKEKQSDLEKELIEFKKRLFEMQVDCPDEFKKIINEHFWELF